MTTNVGMSSDETKRKLSDLAARVETHQKAVDKIAGENPDSRLVAEYRTKWDAFTKKLASLREDAEAWTSAVRESTADLAGMEFGGLLIQFETLNFGVTDAKASVKIKALEEAVKAQGKTPSTAAPFATDHVSNVKSNATAPPAPPASPPLAIPSLPGFPGISPTDGLSAPAKVGLGLGTVLVIAWLLRKMVGG